MGILRLVIDEEDPENIMPAAGIILVCLIVKIIAYSRWLDKKGGR
jgi:hypothetical protein